MRTTIIIDDVKIDHLMALTGSRKKSEAINRAIDYFIENQAKQKLLDLRGELNLQNNWRQIREQEINES